MENLALRGGGENNHEKANVEVKADTLVGWLKMLLQWIAWTTGMKHLVDLEGGGRVGEVEVLLVIRI